MSFLLLGLILLLVAGTVFLNYNALLDADSYTYLIYARDLARGSLFGELGFYEVFKEYWPPHRQVNLHSACRHMVDGRIYHGIEIGYPLLLAVPMYLFGSGSVYFVNPVLLLILIIVFFLTVRLIFYDNGSRDATALLSVLIFLLLPPDRVISSSTKIMRDVPPLVFLITSFYLLLRFTRSRIPSARRAWVFFGAFFLGLAGMIRFHYLVMLIPFFIFLIASLKERGTIWKKGIPAIIFSLIGLALFAVPVMIKDLLVSGDMFRTMKILSDYLLVVSTPSKLFAREYFRRSGLWYFDYLIRVYGPSLIFMGVVGLAAGIKSRPVRLLLVPAALLHFIIFAFFRYHHSRYLLPLYPVVSCLIGYGIVVSLERLSDLNSRSPADRSRIFFFHLTGVLLLIYLIVFRIGSWGCLLSPQNVVILAFALVFLIRPARLKDRFRRKKILLGISIGLIGLLGYGLIPAILKPYSFNLKDARHLRREVEKYVPPGSLVLAARYLKQNIDYYTGSYSFNIYQPGLPWEIPVEVSLRMAMDAGMEVFVFDNKGKRKASKFLSLLKNCFELEPVARWKSEDLNIHTRYVSENEYLSLYRVVPWKEKEVELSLPLSSRADHLLVLDARQVWNDKTRKEIEIFLNRTRLRGKLKNNINYIVIPSRLIGTPDSTLTIISGRGLPSDPAVCYLGKLADGFRIDIGGKDYLRGLGLKDWRFLDDDFFNRFSRDSYRTIEKEGRIKVPAFRVPGKTAVVRLRVRNRLGELSPLRVRVSRDDQSPAVFELAAKNEWVEIEVILPPGSGEIGTAWLGLRVSVLNAPFSSGKGLLDIDWLSIEWRPPPAN